MNSRDLLLSGLLAACTALLSPARAEAFCGFYVTGAGAKVFNDATQVVLFREGARTVLSMQNNYKGPPENFAMVVPVPVILQKENVKTLPLDVFDRIDATSAPRLVEYEEADPCGEAAQYRREHGTDMPRIVAVSSSEIRIDGGIRIEARFTVGEYEVVVLSAGDSIRLDSWLRKEGYKIPDGAAEALRPYVQNGSKFFVARVDPSKVRFVNGEARLSPLRFQYDSSSFSLPVRLGLLNSAGTQDLIVHIFSSQRYDVANYPTAFMPTDLDVKPDVASQFGSFYAALFDREIARKPGSVLTEYVWESPIFQTKCDPCPSVPLFTLEDLMALGLDASRMAHAPVILPKEVSQASTQDARYFGAELMLDTLPELLKCYEALYKKNPKAAGDLSAKIVLTKGAKKLSRVTVTAAPSLDRSMESCAEKALLNRGNFSGTIPGSGDVTLSFTFQEGISQKDVGASLVHTRLHTRYARGTLGEDLVFKAAGAGANFQSRYVIRHPWTGPIRCQNPFRGVWIAPQVRSATNLASVTRTSALEDLLNPSTTPQAPPAAPSSEPPPPRPEPSAGSPSALPAAPQHACGACEIGHASSTGGSSLLWMVAGVALARRRAREVLARAERKSL